MAEKFIWEPANPLNPHMFRAKIIGGWLLKDARIELAENIPYIIFVKDKNHDRRDIAWEL